MQYYVHSKEQKASFRKSKCSYSPPDMTHLACLQGVISVIITPTISESENQGSVQTQCTCTTIPHTHLGWYIRGR